jgi:hypothetical protein
MVVVVDNVVEVDEGTTTVVEIFWLVWLLVGGRNSNTKAATTLTPAKTVKILARRDRLVPDGLTFGGRGGGSAVGGGP